MTTDDAPQPMDVDVVANDLPWVEKYRPSKLEDLISHEDIISTITRLIDDNKLPHLLLYGPPGTGKTSTIVACAKKMYGKNYKNMTLELNASDDRGINVVREQIKDFASTQKIFSSGIKLVILDEADHMTNDAQFSLRRIIEKYTRNTRFCIICNYVGKIIPAVQSRCTKFRFSPLARDQVYGRLKHVIDSENVNVSESGVNALIKLGSGDMRKSLNILQSASLASEEGDEITEETVYTSTGSPLPKDIKQMIVWLCNENFQTAFNNVHNMKTLKGLALQDIITEIHAMVDLIEFPVKAKIPLLQELAEIEYRLTVSTSEKIQLASLVATFQRARDAAMPNKS